jgi:lysophospholipase L1-like esterase
MTQLFIFGASNAYGVGGQNGGWADLLKQFLHQEMYTTNGTGEKYELYNFAKPGATIEFVLNTFADQIKDYGRSGKTIAIVCVGGNNAKAEDNPDNFISTPEQYGQLMGRLLKELGENVDEVITLDNPPVDENKTNPKSNPLTGGKSYFRNARIEQFNQILSRLCGIYDTHYVHIGTNPDEWQQKYQFHDGLHPNHLGHRLIFEKILAQVEPLL